MKNDKWGKSIKFIIEEKFANGSSPFKFKMYEEIAGLLQEGKEYEKRFKKIIKGGNGNE